MYFQIANIDQNRIWEEGGGVSEEQKIIYWNLCDGIAPQLLRIRLK
jgi:hypothetical protein